MEYKYKCPACGLENSVPGDYLDAINASCQPCGDYNDPLLTTENGFKIFFRPYIPSHLNTYVVGVALAWRTKPRKHFGLIAGATANSVFEYKAGEIFPAPLSYINLGLDMNLSVAEFVNCKEFAVKTLSEFVQRLD